MEVLYIYICTYVFLILCTDAWKNSVLVIAIQGVR